MSFRKNKAIKTNPDTIFYITDYMDKMKVADESNVYSFLLDKPKLVFYDEKTKEIYRLEGKEVLDLINQFIKTRKEIFNN